MGVLIETDIFIQKDIISVLQKSQTTEFYTVEVCRFDTKPRLVTTNAIKQDDLVQMLPDLMEKITEFINENYIPKP